MEREYKWKASAQDFDSIMTYLGLSEGGPVAMLAQYYDTRDRLLRSRKIGLRMRSESGETICCLKLRDASNEGLHVHEEYECQPIRHQAGLRQLRRGAPAELCKALRAEELDVVAETKFRRRRAIWKDQCFAVSR